MTVHAIWRSGWVALLLLAVYLAVFSGRLHSIDEVSSVALADSLLLQGQPTTDQIGWSQSWSLPQGTYGLDGHLYSKKGIGMSLVMLPFQWLARQVEGVGIVGMAHLVNPIVTALTGLVLYWLVEKIMGLRGVPVARKGEDEVDWGFQVAPYAGIALFVTLAWGVGTFAVVYSKYLFNSPLVGLLLVVAVFLIVDVSSNLTIRKISALLLSGLCIGLTLIVRAENALLVPVFLLYLLLVAAPAWTTRLSRIVVFSVPVGVIVLWLFWFNTVRFGDFLNFGYDLSQEANGNILVGLAGFIFSPGRSLLLMMPLLIGAIWGWVRLIRSAPRRDTVLPLAWLVVGLTVVYALFFARSADWWGGWNWGIRYFLPLLPLWCLGLAGFYGALRRPSWTAAVVIGLVVLSIGIQALGVLVDFNRPLLADSANSITLDQQLWGWQHAQIISHLRMMGDWQKWDMLAVVVNNWEIVWQPIAVLLLAAVGLFNAFLPRPNPFYQWSLPILGFVLLQWAAVPLQQAATQDPYWSPYRDDLTALNTSLENAPDNSVLLFEMLLYRPYFDRAQAWLNFGRTTVPSLEMGQENTPPDPQQRLRDIAVTEAQTVYVAVEGTAIGDPNSSMERWMSQRAHYRGTEWVSDNTRLTTFYMSTAISTTISAVNFSDNIALRDAKVPPTVTAGQPLLVELVWGATGTPLQDYTVFVQVLDSAGQVVAQQDTAPQASFAPTLGWQAGATIEDRRALLLPDTLTAGQYTVIAGMYDGTGKRLPVATGGDFVTVGIVTVE